MKFYSLKWICSYHKDSSVYDCFACLFFVVQSGTCQSRWQSLCICPYLLIPYSSNVTVCVYKCFPFPCLLMLLLSSNVFSPHDVEILSPPANCRQSYMSQCWEMSCRSCFCSALCYPHTDCKTFTKHKAWNNFECRDAVSKSLVRFIVI